MVRPARFELATFGFGGRHSIQLSYWRKTINTLCYVMKYKLFHYKECNAEKDFDIQWFLY